MENAYTIGVSNRFLLDFDSISDPQDIFAEKEQRIKEKKEKNTKAKQQKKPEPPKKAPEPEQKPRKDDTRQDRNERPDTGRRREGGPRGGGRGGSGGPRRTPRENNYRRSGEGQDLENQENQAPSDYRSSRGDRDRPPRDYQQGDRDRPPREYSDGDRPYRGRGRGRGRGGPRGGFGGRGGKREFDRHSGSDKSSSFKMQDKRDGGGSHNWGTIKDDVKDLNTSNVSEENANIDYQPTNEGEPAENSETPASPTEGEADPNAENAVEKEPEVNEMTLDEYKALKNKERMKSDFKIRRAGEGEDNSQWKQTYVLKKEVPKDDDIHLHNADIYVKDRHMKQDASQLLNIHFNDSSLRGGRGGRGRGGRGGGGRGRGGRGMDREGGRMDREGGRMDREGGRMGGRGGRMGGGRGGRYRDESAIAVDNEEEFPSLSSQPKK